MNHLILLLYLAAFSAGLLSSGAAFYSARKYGSGTGMRFAFFWGSLFLLILFSFVSSYVAVSLAGDSGILGFFLFLLTNGFTVLALLMTALLNASLRERKPAVGEKLILGGLILIYLLVILLLIFSRQSLEWKKRLFEISSFPFLASFLVYLLILMKNGEKTLREHRLLYRISSLLTILYCLLDLSSPYIGFLPGLFSYPVTYLFWSLLVLPAILRYDSERSAKGSHLEIGDEFVARYGITGREREVMALLVEGKTKQEIADSLYIAYKTVDKHVTNIYSKTDVHNKIELISLIGSR